MVGGGAAQVNFQARVGVQSSAEARREGIAKFSGQGVHHFFTGRQSLAT
jgi:hypothetical protein